MNSKFENSSSYDIDGFIQMFEKYLKKCYMHTLIHIEVTSMVFMIFQKLRSKSKYFSILTSLLIDTDIEKSFHQFSLFASVLMIVSI